MEGLPQGKTLEQRAEWREGASHVAFWEEHSRQTKQQVQRS